MAANPLIWLIALPLAAAPIIYLAGRLRLQMSQSAMPHARWVGLAALTITWVPFILLARDFDGAPATVVLGAVVLRFDGLSLLVAALALTIGTLVVLFSGPDITGQIGAEKYYAIVMAMVGAMVGLACATDLFNLWIWFEAMATSAYLLVAFYHERPASLEAGVKYLVQGAAGSALVLLGIALVLAETGTLSLEQLGATARTSPIPLAAGALFVAGFGIKAALVPLHTWLPDAHTQAPSGVSALLSSVVIEVGLVALLRALAALAGGTPSWGELLMGLGALNILVGNLLALRQTQVKRLLAYSSISQVGYMLLGLGIGIYTGKVAGAQGGFFHMLNHGLMKGLAFLAAGALLYALHTAADDDRPLGIADLSGAARRYPLAALGLSVAALGLAGLPPLAGFMSKWQIFVAGVATHDAIIMALVGFAALNSVLSLTYYAPLVNAVYRRAPSAMVQSGRSLPFAIQAPLALLTLAVVTLGVWPSLANWLTEPAGWAVMTAFGR